MNGLPNDHPTLVQAVAAIKATRRAIDLMEQHGLIQEGWQFRVSKTKNSLGRCFYEEKVIEFSEYYLHEDWDEIEDTILHEIAHALAYNRYGQDGADHGPLWKATCIEVGANPRRTAHGVTSAAKYNYEIRCSECNKVTSRKYRLRSALLDRYISKCCKAKLEAFDLREGGE